MLYVKIGTMRCVLQLLVVIFIGSSLFENITMSFIVLYIRLCCYGKTGIKNQQMVSQTGNVTTSPELSQPTEPLLLPQVPINSQPNSRLYFGIDWIVPCFTVDRINPPENLPSIFAFNELQAVVYLLPFHSMSFLSIYFFPFRVLNETKAKCLW